MSEQLKPEILPVTFIIWPEKPTMSVAPIELSDNSFPKPVLPGYEPPPIAIEEPPRAP